jgi:indoleamine 2,3-dioxygenase
MSVLSSQSKVAVTAQEIDLSSFGVSRERGFVPDPDPLDRLPPAFRPWDEAIAELPALIMNFQARRRITEIPELDIDGLRAGGEQERAFVILSSLTMAHVWAGQTPDFTLPRNIAVPFVALAKCLDRPPIVQHATLVLNNWRRLDKNGPVALGNLDTQATFTGSFDEKWFYLATLGVELAGAPVMAALAAAVDHSQQATDPELEERLAPIVTGIQAMTAALMRLRERCDPYIFYHRIRPYLAGWPAPGVVYSGVSDKPQVWSGGSAAQSSLLQSIDAALGIEHEKPATRDFLNAMLQYMPRQHRAFVATLRARSKVRERAFAGHAGLRERYNACIAATDELRRKHIGLTSDYILKQADVVVGPGTTGTGGTDFVEFLRESRIETAQSQLK